MAKRNTTASLKYLILILQLLNKKEKIKRSQRRTKKLFQFDNGGVGIDYGVCRKGIFSIPYY